MHAWCVCFIEPLVVQLNASTPVNTGACPGQEVKVTCQVLLDSRVTGTPIIRWQTPGPLSELTESSPSERVTSRARLFTRELIIDSFNSSHEGTYSCTARVRYRSNLVSVEDQRSIYIDRESKCLSSVYIVTIIYCTTCILFLHTDCLFVEPSIQIHSTQPLHFTAICTSTGGFPANVTWTRDLETIDGGVTVFEDFRRYRHMLNSTQEGVYMCTISNDLPDTATATLNVTSMLYIHLSW